MRLAALSLLLLTVSTTSTASEVPASVTATGWFSDLKCATSRAATGRIGPTGRACSEKCLANGVKLAFIDEKAKAVFEVDNPKAGKALLGDHVEIVATKSGAKTLHITSVTILEKYVARCDVN